MPAPIDRTGTTYGRFTVLRKGDRQGYWWCRCSCGVEKEVAQRSLTTGASQSCGCIRREMVVARNTRHGRSKSATYQAWLSMRRRCQDPNYITFAHYGGRGIAVAAEWDTFEQFLADMGESPGQGYSVGRIDNEQGYQASNCRWETPIEQQRNKRNTRLLTFRGVSRSMAEWAE